VYALSVRLKRCVYALMVLLASWAVVLAVSPAMAEAQGIARTKDAQKGTERIVVSPGDSLWSISSERLGPNATPQQIANAVERIYALNQNQIGADPNLIFPGQRLSAPPVVVGEPSTAEASTGAAPARGATEPAKAGTTGRAAANSSGTADQASRTPIGTTDAKGEKASDPVAEAVNLPEVAAAAPVPAVRSLAAKASPRSPVESFAKMVRSAVSAAESAVGTFPREDYFGRKLLGLGIVVLTLIVCGLMAWKLPMRRNVGDSAAWGIPRGYPNYRAEPEALDRYADTSAEPSPRGFGPGRSLGGSEDELSVAEKNDLGRVGIVGAVRGRRERIRRGRAPKRIGRRRAPRPRRRSREGSVTGAYSPKIYRALSRAALETRPQRSANGHANGTRREEGAASARALLLRKPETDGNGHKPLGGLVGNEESRPEQRIHLLSARQQEILELVAEGLPNAQIAQRLFVTESTVKQHLHKAYRTLGVRNRREATKFLESSNDRAERQPVRAVGVRL
jgi:DNA-binding CsgD family transcriptional regulator/LysM repeat protein